MSDVKVIQLGLGKVISNYGTHNGVPSVFIEPVLADAGELGADLTGDREPQITKNSVSAGGLIIEIHEERGLKVLLEDFQSALSGAK